MAQRNSTLPIRIMTDPKVCGDYYSAFKYTSKIEVIRIILMRYSNRFSSFSQQVWVSFLPSSISIHFSLIRKAEKNTSESFLSLYELRNDRIIKYFYLSVSRTALFSSDRIKENCKVKSRLVIMSSLIYNIYARGGMRATSAKVLPTMKNANKQHTRDVYIYSTNQSKKLHFP